MRFVLGLIAAACVTQAANAKIYKGKVVDASTKEPLIGATVEVSGTSMGTVTDIDGCFTIDCKDGAKLTVKYVSYKTSSTIASDGMTVQMSPDSQTLGEVTVAARKRHNLDSSVLEAARNGLTMQSGVSAQQIRRTQDKDASEVIRRVPGISIIDDKFVMVRGLSQRYNNVWINGSAVPSSEAASRAFSFDIIPSSQLDNLMIVKSPAPEYPADFSGGFILINTKDIPEQNGFSLSLGGNINEKTHFRNFLHSKGSATDFLGFDNGMRNFNGGINGQLRPTTGGVDLNGNGFNNDWTLRTSTPWADLSLSAELTRVRRFDNGARAGLLGAINYSYSNRTVIGMENSLFGAYDVEHDTPNYLRHSVDDQYTTNARLGAMLNIVYISASGNNHLELKNIFNQLGKDRYTFRNGFSAQSDPVQSAEYNYSSRATYNGQLTGKHTLNDNIIDWSAGYSYADKNMPDRKRYTLTDDQKDGRYGVIAGNDINREYTLLKEHIVSVAANYSRTFAFDRISPMLKAGAYGEYRTRAYTTRSFIYGELPASMRYADMPELLSDVSNYGPDKLYLIEEVKWRNNYDGNNTLAAAYASVNIPFGKFNIYAGVRFEHDRMELVSNTQDHQKSPTSTYYTFNDFFPSVNATYRLSDKQQLRLAYGKSVNRPEFREVSSSVFYDFDLSGNIQGNPNLTACYVHNVDLRYELYPSKSELVSVALFYKNFQNPIEWTYTVAGGTDPIYSYKNAKGAYSYGVELDVKKSLDFIGVPDLSLVFNGALIKSKVNFDKGDQEKNRPMQGQSPYIINTGLFYQNSRIGLSAALLYNRIGKRIVGVGRSMGSVDDNVRIPDSYEMPRNAVDINLSKKIGSHFELKLSVKDLLGESVVFKQFEDGIRLNNGTVKNAEEVTRCYKPGRNYSLSVTYNF